MEMDARQVTVSLSIVNTDNRELLRRFLRTIAHGTRSAHEVIVVDNASTDGSVEMLEREFPGVKVIRNATRQGYGSSHNRALQVARGRFVLILNEDMEIIDDAVDRMVKTAERIDGLGVLGCRLVSPDMTLQVSCFRFPTLAQELFEAVFPYTVAFPRARIRSRMDYWPHDQEADVDIVVGCCMLIPRTALERVGGFDPGFFVYSEEHDLCRRMRNAGLRVVFTPHARMIHFGGQTSRRMSTRMALVQVESRIRYFRKHHGRIACALFRAIVLLAAAWRLAGWAAVYPLARQARGQAREKLKEYARTLGVVVNAG
jgi:GT2 family glycosyltransferase